MFRIASVYAPNRNPERDEFFTSRLDFADPSVPTILCGDFNAVFDRAKDLRGSDPAVTVQWGANGRIGKVVGDSSFLSFLAWFECVSLGRLCWLYCGLLGSGFFA